MLEFMKMGGALMWPILVVGLMSIFVSLREVLLGAEPGPAARRLALSSLSTAIGGSLCGLVMTCTHGTGDPAIVVRGVGESCCPAALGLLLFGLGQLLLAVAPARRVRA